MDFSLPGSSVHGISQARVHVQYMEWGAIAFSTAVPLDSHNSLTPTVLESSRSAKKPSFVELVRDAEKAGVGCCIQSVGNN